MKIILSGGGTLGPVTPLLAIKEVIEKNKKDTQFIWLISKNGPEKKFIEDLGIFYIPISSGKFRRYFSFLNISDIFNITIGFFQSLKILKKEKPDLCISAGGFISVPVHIAAWILRIPTWIHQQDIRVGASNEIMAPLAKVITTSLRENMKNFSPKKTCWLGNPIRRDIRSGTNEDAIKIFNLKKDLPVVFVTGGGTGSLRINQMVVESLERISNKVQIIHLTGKEHSEHFSKNAEKHFDNYHVYDFFGEEMKHAYKIADIVVSRGGFGTISEIAALGKASILIPKPGHQEENVEFLRKNNAVLFLSEIYSQPGELGIMILDLIENRKKIEELGNNLNKLLPPASDSDIVEVLNNL